MPSAERQRLLADTTRIIRAIEPEMSRAIAIGATVFLWGAIGAGFVIAYV